MGNTGYILKNCFIVIFLLGLTVVATHGMLTDSSFFSWSMFSYRFEYTIGYSLEYDNGTIEPLADEELKIAMKKGSSYYKVGDLLMQVQSFLEYVYEKRNRSDIQIIADIEYTINFQDTRVRLTYPKI